VTLCFLGAVPEAAVAGIARACDVVAGSAAGGLALSAPVWLPRRRPRVLAVLIGDRDGELGALQSKLSAALVREKVYAPEARRFLAHVTVARVRGREKVDSAPLPFPAPVEFAARHVTLYRSHLGGGPARYEMLHRIPLDGAG